MVILTSPPRGRSALSDPDQVFNPETNELWLYYRAVTTENEIFLIRGSGPSTWSTPTLVAHAANHSIVSPTVVRRGPGDWLMWAVNSGPEGCAGGATTVELRRSGDGVNWSNVALFRSSRTSSIARPFSTIKRPTTSRSGIPVRGSRTDAMPGELPRSS